MHKGFRKMGIMVLSTDSKPQLKMHQMQMVIVVKPKKIKAGSS